MIKLMTRIKISARSKRKSITLPPKICSSSVNLERLRSNSQFKRSSSSWLKVKKTKNNKSLKNSPNKSCLKLTRRQKNSRKQLLRRRSSLLTNKIKLRLPEELLLKLNLKR